MSAAHRIARQTGWYVSSIVIATLARVAIERE